MVDGFGNMNDALFGGGRDSPASRALAQERLGDAQDAEKFEGSYMRRDPLDQRGVRIAGVGPYPA